MHTSFVSRHPQQPQGWPVSLFRSDRVETRGLASPAAGAAYPRQTYKLIVLCCSTEAGAVEAKLRGLLNVHGLGLVSLQREQTKHVRVRIDVQVASSVPERAALVRIVNQLTAEPAIRFLQWETVPHP
jgi:hypothetical protein